MLSQDHFYWGMFKKYIIAFNHIISDIHVLRTTADNVTVKDITVPVTYAHKSKLFYYLQRQDSVKRNVKTILPRISFIISGMEYDVSRKLSSLNECSISTTSGIETFQYTGIPYNFTIEMGIWSTYMDDLLQIIEQVGTFFKPDYSMSVKEIEAFNITKNILVTLDGINFDFINEFDVDDRVIRADATFRLQGFLYPPVSNGEIIKEMYIAMRNKVTEETAETIFIDWNEINDEITTEIIEGQAYYEFNSAVNMISSTVSDGDKALGFISNVNIITDTVSDINS